MILFLEQLIIIIILKCFQKNVSKLLKKIPEYITDNIEISSDSDREDLDKEKFEEHYSYIINEKNTNKLHEVIHKILI